MSKKTVRARDRVRDDADEVGRREDRRRARVAAVARYKVQARINSMYLDAALGRPA